MPCPPFLLTSSALILHYLSSPDKKNILWTAERTTPTVKPNTNSPTVHSHFEVTALNYMSPSTFVTSARKERNNTYQGHPRINHLLESMTTLANRYVYAYKQRHSCLIATIQDGGSYALFRSTKGGKGGKGKVGEQRES